MARTFQGVGGAGSGCSVAACDAIGKSCGECRETGFELLYESGKNVAPASRLLDEPDPSDELWIE